MAEDKALRAIYCWHTNTVHSCDGEERPSEVCRESARRDYGLASEETGLPVDYGLETTEIRGNKGLQVIRAGERGPGLDFYFERTRGLAWPRFYPL